MNEEDISKDAAELIKWRTWRHRNDKANYEFEKRLGRHSNPPMEDVAQKEINDAIKELRCHKKQKPKNKDRFKHIPDGTNPITDTLDT